MIKGDIPVLLSGVEKLSLIKILTVQWGKLWTMLPLFMRREDGKKTKLFQ